MGIKQDINSLFGVDCEMKRRPHSQIYGESVMLSYYKWWWFDQYVVKRFNRLWIDRWKNIYGYKDSEDYCGL